MCCRVGVGKDKKKKYLQTFSVSISFYCILNTMQICTKVQSHKLQMCNISGENLRNVKFRANTCAWYILLWLQYNITDLLFCSIELLLDRSEYILYFRNGISHILATKVGWNRNDKVNVLLVCFECIFIEQ